MLTWGATRREGYTGKDFLSLYSLLGGSADSEHFSIPMGLLHGEYWKL